MTVTFDPPPSVVPELLLGEDGEPGPELAAAIAQWGDLHTATAALVLGERYINADTETRAAMRQWAKEARFMLNYGGTPVRR